MKMTIAYYNNSSDDTDDTNIICDNMYKFNQIYFLFCFYF